MADVSIKYKDGVIAEMDSNGTKTLNTSGCYCEGNVVVDYAPRCRTYEITLPRSSNWILLTTLDSDVLAHIDDEDFTVLMTRQGAYSYDWYAGNCYFAGNKPIGYNEQYPVYGYANRLIRETGVQTDRIYYAANTKTPEVGLGGNGQFYLNGNQYNFRPGDGFIQAGNYKLTFQW